MIHILKPHHYKHFSKLGLKIPLGGFLSISDAEYAQHYIEWHHTLPEASKEELHTRVMAHVQTIRQHQHAAQPANHRTELRIIGMLLALLLILLLATRAHGQFSQITTITGTDGATTLTTAGPFKMSFSGCTVGGTGAAWTINCTGGAANPGGTAHQLQVNLNGTGFAGVANGTAGQVLCSNGTTLDPSMCDPIVSGPDAPGVAPTKNPVQIGLFDGTNVQRILGSAAGRLSVDVNSAPTTAVTGTFFQSTQPVSSLQLPAALDGSGFLKTHEQGTAAISAASLPLPSGAATAAKQPALGTAGSASADVISIQGVTSMTPVKVDGSGVTQPVSGTVTVQQATGTNLHTVCDSGCSSSTAPADASAFTESTTSFSPIGGYFRTSPTSLTTDHMGTVGMTATRHLLVNLPDALPAGTNVIGHVIADSGSTTAVTGNVASTVADGADVTLGAKADAKSTATDTTAITLMQVLKEISAMEQAPASRAVTNAGTFAVQATDNLTQVAGSNLGATAIVNYGSTPAGVAVPAVNAFVTNVNANGQAVMASSAPVVIASNQSAIAAAGQGATGSAVPTGSTYIGGNGSGNLTGIIACDNSSAVNMVTATTTQIVAISGTAGRTYVCSINLVAAGADNVALISGSGANCGSNQAGLAGGVTAATGWNFAANGGLTLGNGLGMVFKTVTTNNELCLVTSAAVQLSGTITWTQF